MSNKLFLSVTTGMLILLSFFAGAQSVGNDGIVRDDLGRLFEMNQPNAIQFCRSKGLHLPTIRELLMLNQNEGILLKEPNQVTSGEIQSGAMTPVIAFDAAGRADRFYYNRDNYILHIGDESNYFWSSSIYTNMNSYSFGGQYGDVYDGWTSERMLAVRCLPN